MLRKLFFTILLFISVTSFAQLKVRNNSKEGAYIAIGYNENGKWYSKGWWEVKAGQEIIVYNKPLSNRYYYYCYAEGKDCSVFSIYSASFYIHPRKKFDIQEDTVKTAGAFRVQSFVGFTVKNNPTYTIVLEAPIKIDKENVQSHFDPFRRSNFEFPLENKQ
jgi:uncharacterized membrane protein